MSSTTTINLAPVILGLFQNSFSPSMAIIDTSGNTHNVPYVVYVIPGQGVLFFFIDSSDSQYNTSYVQLTATVSGTSYTVLQIPVSASKQSNQVLMITVGISVTSQYLSAQLIDDIYYALGTVLAPWTLQAQIEIVQYNSDSSTSTCLNTISSTSTNTYTASYSYSNENTLATISVSLSGCQQAIMESAWIQDSQGNESYITIPSSYQETSETGYNQSPTYTWTFTFSAST